MTGVGAASELCTLLVVVNLPATCALYAASTMTRILDTQSCLQRISYSYRSLAILHFATASQGFHDLRDGGRLRLFWTHAALVARL